MRVKIVVTYKGTSFCGFARQKNGFSVQEALENAVEEVFKKKTKVYASGRTDEGVHATAQVCHFDVSSVVPPEKIALALNTKLPNSVKVVSSEKVSDGFNARYDVKRKTYEYKMYVSPYEDPLKEGFALWLKKDVDEKEMQKAANCLLGTHDFKCFQAANADVTTTVRTVYEATVERSGNELVFKITGNGFLYNMVRIIVGTLIAVGEGKIPPEQMAEIIESKDRSKAGKTVAPYGLYLQNVNY